MMSEVVVSILLDAAARAVLLLVHRRLDYRVTNIPICMPLGVLDLDLLVHLHQVHGPLLLLILLHELLQHLLHVLLALLLDIVLDEPVDLGLLTVLIRDIGIDILVALRNTGLLISPTFAFAALTLLRPLIALVTTER